MVGNVGVFAILLVLSTTAYSHFNDSFLGGPGLASTLWFCVPFSPKENI